MIWSICIILTALALDEPDVESAGPTADPTEYWEWYLDSWEESTLWQAWWEEGRECADEAHLSLQCLFSLSKCTCAEILDDAKGCNWYYNPTELFSPNDEECDIERVIFSIMWWSDGSDDYEDACSELVSVGETTGELPYSKCECFSLVPVETASAIFNCVYDGNSLLDTWETCAGANHSSSLTFGMLPTEDCRLSCGMCTISPTAGPTNTEPTEEQANNWWVYLIIVVGVIILLAVIIVCLRGGITSRTTAKEGVATAAEMCTRKDHADFGEKEGEL